MKNKNKGFSLVELIVVVAIMAVLMTVLAPQLIRYVDKTRRQKDLSAMYEMFNVLQLMSTEYIANNYVGEVGYFGLEFNRKVIVDLYGSVEDYIDIISEAGGDDMTARFLVEFYNATNSFPDSSLGEDYGWVITYDIDYVKPVFAGLFKVGDANRCYILYPNHEDFMNGTTVTMSELQEKMVEEIDKRNAIR